MTSVYYITHDDEISHRKVRNVNPAQMADFLSREDILDLIEILKKKGKNILEIAGNFNLERRTIYNLKDTTTDVTIETKRKVVNHFLQNDRDTLYSLLHKKLEYSLSDLILDIYSRKFFQISKMMVDSANLRDEIDILYKELTNYDYILQRQVPDRYLQILDELSVKEQKKVRTRDLFYHHIKFDEKQLLTSREWTSVITNLANITHYETPLPASLVYFYDLCKAGERINQEPESLPIYQLMNYWLPHNQESARRSRVRDIECIPQTQEGEMTNNADFTA